ncbi:MAG: hypothetical protein ACTHZ5_01085 [Micrococcaceae bacterium]
MPLAPAAHSRAPRRRRTLLATCAATAAGALMLTSCGEALEGLDNLGSPAPSADPSASADPTATADPATGASEESAADVDETTNGLISFDNDDEIPFLELRPAEQHAAEVLPALTTMVESMIEADGESLRMPLPDNRPYRVVSCSVPDGVLDAAESASASPAEPTPSSSDAPGSGEPDDDATLGMTTADNGAVPTEAARIVMDNLSVQDLDPVAVADAGDDLFSAVGYSEADRPASMAGYTTLTWVDETNDGEITSLTSEGSHTALNARSGCLPTRDLSVLEDQVQELNDEFHARIFGD